MLLHCSLRQVKRSTFFLMSDLDQNLFVHLFYQTFNTYKEKVSQVASSNGKCYNRNSNVHLRLGVVGPYVTALIPDSGSLFVVCLLRVNFVDVWICCVLGLPIFPVLSWPLEENLAVVLGLLLSRSSCSWVSCQAGHGSRDWP